MLSVRSSPSFQDDMIRVVDRLPTESESRRVQHLVLERGENDLFFTDDEVATTLEKLENLETADLSGIPDITDRTLVLLAAKANNLTSLKLAGCSGVTDIGILELVSKTLPITTLVLDGVTGVTDSAICSLARSCSLCTTSPFDTPFYHMAADEPDVYTVTHLELSELPLLTCISIRDIWSFSRKLRTLRLMRCSLLGDKSFPVFSPNHAKTRLSLEGAEKPLPPRPTTWLESLPPLILSRSAENLRVLDLSFCPITDAAVGGVCAHAPRIQNLVLSGCMQLTDIALEHVCLLGSNLDVLQMDRCPNITDAGVIKLARASVNLRALDLSFCRNLTDMSIHELSGLKGLRRLSLVRVHRLTDIALLSLAQYCEHLESIDLSYCDRLSLEAIHVLLKKVRTLNHLTGIGIPSLKRVGISRFSDSPPDDLDDLQKAAFRVFNGDNVTYLVKFLDKEEKRRRECEAKNIRFVVREDDSLDLY